MARLFCAASRGASFLRVVAAFTLVSLAFFLGSLDPFLRAAPIGGPGVNTPATPATAVSVNRYRKGDLLPVLSNSDNSNRTDANRATWWDLREPDGVQARRKVPVGCDPAFSPVSSPSLAAFFGRCTT
jgi:hypothetical protein